MFICTEVVYSVFMAVAKMLLEQYAISLLMHVWNNEMGKWKLSICEYQCLKLMHTIILNTSAYSSCSKKIKWTLQLVTQLLAVFIRLPRGVCVWEIHLQIKQSRLCLYFQFPGTPTCKRNHAVVFSVHWFPSSCWICVFALSYCSYCKCENPSIKRIF